MIKGKSLLRAVAVLFCGFCISFTAQAATKPRLIVKIVVGGLRADELRRFGSNLSENGFNRFINSGVVYTNARYGFMTTTPPATLATIVSGANPDIHGIVGRSWFDIVSGNPKDLIADDSARGLDTNPNEAEYSYHNQIVATFGDALLLDDKNSKEITIAADPVSSVVLGGRRGEVYWIDESAATWISSSKYMDDLPEWVKSYNTRAYERGELYLRFQWLPTLTADKYINSRYSCVEIKGDRFVKLADNGSRKIDTKRFSKTMTTPVVSDFTADFVRQAITYAGLGKDNTTDLLNIYFGNLRTIGEEFGRESVEMEDALYRLDKAIELMCDFILSQFGDQVLFVLTSDGGLSASFDFDGEPRERFNTEQFKVIANSFLTAQFGGSNWILGCIDRRIYLNHNQAYRMGISVNDVRDRLTTFTTAYPGVMTAMSSAALHIGGFQDPVRGRMQAAFYPKRSGDVMISLAPGWIEVVEGVRAQSGSLYDYDVHVLLMFYNAGMESDTIIRNVDMNSLSVALADIVRINRPEGAMGDTLPEIVDNFR